MRYILLTILFAFSCSPGSDRNLVEYRNGRQLLNVNETQRNGDRLDKPTVKRLSPDSISVGEEFLARIFLDDKDFDLVAAYFDCDTSQLQTVDTTTAVPYKIDGCKWRLEVKSDTIFIAFHGGKPGKRTFHEITILTRDREKIYRTQKYTFDYTVTEKN